MKKKRLRLVTTIAILAALFGSGGGTAWGQLSPGAVNNVFGAGESAFIGQGNNGAQQVSAPWALPRTFTYQIVPHLIVDLLRMLLRSHLLTFNWVV